VSRLLALFAVVSLAALAFWPALYLLFYILEKTIWHENHE